MDFKNKYKTLLLKWDINTKLRYCMLVAEMKAESGLKLVREDMYYKTIKQARDMFYTPFLGKSDEFVTQYLRNPEKLANYVYANRGGNGNVASGDGWKYRAGGYIGITFKNTYEKLSKDTGIDFVNNPDLLLIEVNALIASLWFWKENKLNTHADRGDLDAVSDLINIGKRTKTVGDANGYKHRKTYYEELIKMDY